MRKTLVSLLFGTVLATLTGTAAARLNVDVGIVFGIPAPVYVVPPPPVVYYPRPVYYVAPPVYYAPPPVHYRAPAYYVPQHRHGHHRGGHKHYRY